MLVDAATTSGNMEPPSRILGMKSPAWGFYYSFFAKEKMAKGCLIQGYKMVFGWTFLCLWMDYMGVFEGTLWAFFEGTLWAFFEGTLWAFFEGTLWAFFGWIMRRFLD